MFVLQAGGVGGHGEHGCFLCRWPGLAPMSHTAQCDTPHSLVSCGGRLRGYSSARVVEAATSAMSAACAVDACGSWWARVSSALAMADPVAVTTVLCLCEFSGPFPPVLALIHPSGRRSDSVLCRGQQAGARTAGGGVDVVDQPEQMALAR